MTNPAAKRLTSGAMIWILNENSEMDVKIVFSCDGHSKLNEMNIATACRHSATHIANVSPGQRP